MYPNETPVTSTFWPQTKHMFPKVPGCSHGTLLEDASASNNQFKIQYDIIYKRTSK